MPERATDEPQVHPIIDQYFRDKIGAVQEKAERHRSAKLPPSVAESGRLCTAAISDLHQQEVEALRVSWRQAAEGNYGMVYHLLERDLLLHQAWLQRLPSEPRRTELLRQKTELQNIAGLLIELQKARRRAA